MSRAKDEISRSSKLACIELIISDFILRTQKLGKCEAFRKTGSLMRIIQNKISKLTDRTKAKLSFDRIKLLAVVC